MLLMPLPGALSADADLEPSDYGHEVRHNGWIEGRMDGRTGFVGGWAGVRMGCWLVAWHWLIGCAHAATRLVAR